jgi:hypothetical protein
MEAKIPPVPLKGRLAPKIFYVPLIVSGKASSSRRIGFLDYQMFVAPLKSDFFAGYCAGMFTILYLNIWERD